MSRPATDKADVPGAVIARRARGERPGGSGPRPSRRRRRRPATSPRQLRGVARRVPRRRVRPRPCDRRRRSDLRLVQEEDRRRDVPNPPLAILLETPLHEQTERCRHLGRQQLQSGSVPSDRRQRVGDVVASRTRACRSASRRARSRTPRCLRVCRPALPRACSGLM